MDNGSMEQIGEIIIHQTLHGYKDGHTLLASSSDLMPLDKRALLSMSDSSGAIQDKKFSEYVTGYPLPENKYYALAKTWSAPEMSRPGCVWTHTLLIPIAFLDLIYDLNDLLELFIRPQINQYSEYSSTIVFYNDASSQEHFQSLEAYSDLSSCLYENSEKSIVVFAESSKSYETELLNIWNDQWLNLKCSFLFCTGSSSLKSALNKNIDIQVLPFKQERTVDREDNSIYLKFQENWKNNSKGKWTKVFDSDRHTSFMNFLAEFGNDIAGLKSRFIPLVECFGIMSKGIDEKSFGDLLDVIEQNFVVAGEGAEIRSWLFAHAVDNKKISIYTVLKSLIKFGKINNSEEKWAYFTNLFNASAVLEKLQQNQVRELILDVAKNNKSLFSKLIDGLPFKFWFDLDLVDDKVIAKYLKDKTNYYDITLLFQANDIVQHKWIDNILKSSRVEWPTFVHEVLTNGKSEWYSTIISNSGFDGFDALMDWVSKVNKTVPDEFDSWIQDNYLEFFSCLSNQNGINDATAMLLLYIFSPTEKLMREIDANVWVNIIHKSESIKDLKAKSGLLTFVLHGALLNNFQSSASLSSLAFQKLHDLLSASIVDEVSWKRFQYAMGNELYELSERGVFRSLWKDTYDVVPEWDKCEFLRRSYVCAFINFQWDVSLFLEGVTSSSTLKDVFSFLLSVKAGKKLTNKVKDFVDSSEKYKIKKDIFFF
jgi:hypothetical protein